MNLLAIKMLPLALSLAQPFTPVTALEIVNYNDSRILYPTDQKEAKCGDIACKAALSAQISTPKTSSGGIRFWILSPKGCWEENSDVQVQVGTTTIQPNGSNLNLNDPDIKSVGAYEYHYPGGDDFGTYYISLLPRAPIDWVLVYQIRFEEVSFVPAAPSSTIKPSASSINPSSTSALSQKSTFSTSLSPGPTENVSLVTYNPTHTSEKSSTSLSSSSLSPFQTASSDLHNSTSTSKMLAIGLGTSLPLFIIICATLLFIFLHRKSRGSTSSRQVRLVEQDTRKTELGRGRRSVEMPIPFVNTATSTLPTGKGTSSRDGLLSFTTAATDTARQNVSERTETEEASYLGVASFDAPPSYDAA
ncbi:hypothetical protein CPB83DRAFT_889115 [Crepidotus variabilis]|uniref:Uncharacterized protein n=1 Tax=Crepidotus variabilis TaxID=179855 RepID=A0A9P6JW50_9AGAR|nr:hypothetical protein CPB83DRAFT_889115 [Crepidotus variabilis]